MSHARNDTLILATRLILEKPASKVIDYTIDVSHSSSGELCLGFKLVTDKGYINLIVASWHNNKQRDDFESLIKGFIRGEKDWYHVEVASKKQLEELTKKAT